VTRDELGLKTAIVRSSHCYFRPLGAAVLTLLTLLRSAAIAEEVRVYGVTLPPTSPTPGAFQPAGTNLTCYGFDKDGRCWDGKAWHNVHPPGPRRYARAQGQVDCVVVTKATGDCWDGHAWYKLPLEAVSGLVLPAFQGGAFRTTPLPPEAER
jgi:hypothetical protein